MLLDKIRNFLVSSRKLLCFTIITKIQTAKDISCDMESARLKINYSIIAHKYLTYIITKIYMQYLIHPSMYLKI